MIEIPRLCLIRGGRERIYDMLQENRQTEQSRQNHKIKLVLCDLALLLFVDVLMLVIYPSEDEHLATAAVVLQTLLGIASIFGWRSLGGVYRQIWRYGGTVAYMQMILMDLFAGMTYFAVQTLTMPTRYKISFVRALCIVALNLLFCMTIRFVYQYLYEYNDNRIANTLRRLTSGFTGLSSRPQGRQNGRNITPKINIAVVGAGRVGVMFAEELANNPRSAYRPCCFIDIDREKIGRSINGIPVLWEEEATQERLMSFPIQEIVFALPKMQAERKKELYDLYKQTGCKLKVYDYPLTQTVENGKRSMREFDIEELLFRQPMEFTNERTHAYYRGKTVLISGGGGSIGSELCRQIAKSSPKQLIIFDIYENNAYDIQMELKRNYPNLNLVTLIGSVRNTARVDQVLDRYRPELVFHAAAHKHVPLMEDSPNEAIKNNVFGTYKMARAAAAHGVKRFVLISTDKAVNPTNIMGASKRLCEMVVQMMNRQSDTEFVAVRFGNVLGSNGSVIPLFKKQIEQGGPVTVTHPDIIRYFMTIPEAVSLVLQAGYYARGGEIFVLDMGEPVKIDDMARNLIRLSGYEPDVDIRIQYTGLRPGEKLYEELLMEEEGLQETANKLIHIGKPIEMDDEKFQEQLARLDAAYRVEADNMKELVAEIVPTYHPQTAVK